MVIWRTSSREEDRGTNSSLNQTCDETPCGSISSVGSAATLAVPETTLRSPQLVDPTREHCRRFWRINGLRRGTIDDVPLAWVFRINPNTC